MSQRSLDYSERPPAALFYAIASFILIISGQILIFAIAPRYELVTCIQLQLFEDCGSVEAIYYKLFAYGIGACLLGIYFVLKTFWQKPIGSIKALILQRSRKKWWEPVKMEDKKAKTDTKISDETFQA